MRTIGQILKDARMKKNFSFEEVEEETKIKKNFIKAIEDENWNLLPEFPVILGFVKNLASFLGLREENASAILKRDYPPRDLHLTPKPDVGRNFVWGPRLTFILGGVIILILVASYLIFQYTKFISPPYLSLSEPNEGAVIDERIVKVIGQTDSNATVKINNQPVLVGENGNFVIELNVLEGDNEVKIVATSRSGKKSIINRKIKVETKQ